MDYKKMVVVAVCGFGLWGCGVTLELGSSELDLITTEEVVLTADQPGNVTTSSDLVQTKWESSDESVATVVQDPIDPRVATVTAMGGGTAEISVKEGGEPTICTVTVTPGAPLTITVAPEAFQLIEPQVDGFTLGNEGYSSELDEYAYFLDTGASDTVLAEAGEVDFTFMTPTSWVLTGARYQLTSPIVVEDGVLKTYVFEGGDGDYEEVP